MSITTNILITGGCGFIGKELTMRLSENSKNSIWVLDNLHPQIHGKDVLAPEFNSNVKFVLGDVRDKEKLIEVVIESKPNIIYHLAAETGTGQSMDEIVRYCDVNIQGTASLLEVVKNSNCDLSKIIIPSSRAIYGEGAYIDKKGNYIVPGSRDFEKMEKKIFGHHDSNGDPLIPVRTKESVNPSPISIYASTKLMQEYLIEQAGSGEKWKGVFLRLQNVYGPGQSLNNPYTGVLSIFSAQLKKGIKLNIYEDGDIVRDFVYITDVVNALAIAAKTELEHGVKLNIGSGVPSKMIDVAKSLTNIYKIGSDMHYISGDYRKGDIRYAVADITQAKSLLNWQPTVELITGLESLAKWSNVKS